ncbi:protein NRT1/ PTR FAMILY 8.1-like isoform X1 [Rhododendron vialii]|uniref:protein NRT1/ PTR FAMILY 8.1-like isoform X1 n=1 Tax=Rhododendron vialii TaxID=182163 RepID=UPI00266013E1|nr:protein NRT1/ PTR FAMILY 8.1-like isoform X1 [Rhododendron vialii]XP_058212948.1 protein NRT1/ PTR FAMILY 8.1-like isoform X1 [Rhododendron vialii]
MAEDGKITNDGTVDIHKNPANKKETGNWKACRFIVGNECFESLAYYGMCTNLVNYLEKRLNMGNVAASNSITNWSGTCSITPLIGAFLADSYLGRYWTIASFSILCVFGMTLLTLSASVKGLKPSCENDVCHPTSSQTAVCFIALYLIALGTGGITPCVSSFGADQFDETDETEKKKKSSYFNWYYMSINVGALIASSVLVWIQMNVGWGWGFGIPAVAMAIAVVFFFSGSRLYRLQKPGGSALTRMFQVLVASLRKSNVKVPEDKSLLYETIDEECNIKGSRKLEHTRKLRFFDKAAVETISDHVKGAANPWRLCAVTQVEELKSVIRLLPIWATGIVFSTVYNQMNTMFILQGNTMDQHMGPRFKIPSACLSLFDTLSVIFWVPVYDRLIMPFARKYTGHECGFTQLQRMGIGLVISIFSMVAAGVLEVVRLNFVRRHNYYDVEEIPMSIFWQVPQYLLIGCAEVFTFIGQLEFFYDQAPDAMRSLCSALPLTAVALGNYLSTLLVTVVTNVTTRNGKLGWIPDNLNKGHLDYFYWILAILSVINFFVYLWISKWYTYKKAKGTA